MAEREIKYVIIIRARGDHRYQYHYLNLLETLSRENKKNKKGQGKKEKSKKMITSIYIKPSKRKCSVSNYRCFDIYDQDMNLIPMKDCDVISIRIENIKFDFINFEVVNGMIHLWSHSQLDFEPLINTFVVCLKK